MNQNCPDQIKQWLAFPFDFINPEHRAGLDFSMESLELADRCLGELRAGMNTWPQNDFQQLLNMVVLGWGAYIGETVRCSDPAWTWDFPDPSTGELPQLVREGPGGVGRMVWPAAKMALTKLHEEELNIALLTKTQMDEVAQMFAHIEDHPDFWTEET